MTGQRAAFWVGAAWLFLFPSEVQSQDIRYADFSETSALVFSGHTGEIAKKRGRKKSLRLTDELFQHGGAFFRRRIRLTEQASFSTSFSFRIHRPMGATDSEPPESDGLQGADGIVFVIQSKSDQVGSSGAGIGYEGITPSLGIEFDTWKNEHDPDGNHVGLNLNGDMRSLQTVKIPVAMNNGSIWYAWVDYHGPSKALEVRLSQTSKRPVAPLLRRKIDLASLFQRPDVFVGFTSATGLAGNYHDILAWTFWSHYAPLEATGQILVTEKVAHQVTPHQIGIVLDASGSMLLKAPSKERRMDLAKRVLRDLLPSFPPGTHVGLLAYGHRYRPFPVKRSCQDTEMIVPFGPLDPVRFLEALSKIKPRGQTPIGRAIAQIGAAFHPSSKSKWIVVLSDGIETCDPRPSDPFYPLRVVKDLEKKGIRLRVNLVGLAISKQKTHRFLREIAKASGGSYWNVQSAGELKQAFQAAMTVRFSLRPLRNQSPQEAPILGSVGSSPVSLSPGFYLLEAALPSGVLRRRVEIRAGLTTHLLLQATPAGFVLVEKAEDKAPSVAGKDGKAEGKNLSVAGKDGKAEDKNPPPAPPLTKEGGEKRSLLPALATLPHPFCFPDTTALSTEALFEQTASFSFQLYEGILRGELGTCLAHAGSSLEIAALLASLLRLKKESVRIAQAILSPAERDAVFRIFLQREAKRLLQHQASEATEEAAFQAMLEGFPDLAALEVTGLVPSRQASVRSVQHLRDFLLSRPEQLTFALLQKIRKVWPQTQDEIRSLMKKRADLLRSRLLRHTWVQVKRGGGWLDLDPALALPVGRAFRKPDLLLSLEEALQAAPPHRISFEIRATFQAGAQRKERSVLLFQTDAASLAGQPISLTFAPTQAFEEAQLAGAINKLLHTKDAGLPYRPVLSVGTKLLEGRDLTIQDWRPAQTPDPFGLSALSGDPSSPLASSPPELVSVASSIRYLPPQGPSEIHRRLLFDRSLPADEPPLQAKANAGAWPLKPLSPAILQTLRSLRMYSVLTGSWPIEMASNLPFPPAHPAFQQPSSLLAALHSYIQRQHNHVFGGRSFGYLHTPSILGLEIHQTPLVKGEAKGPTLQPAKEEAKGSKLPYVSFDIVRQGWLALRYDDPARVGLLTAAVEHTFGEFLGLLLTGVFRSPASLVSIFQAADDAKIPLRLIRQASELAALAIPASTKAALLPLLQGSWLLLPERPVSFQGRERLAWLRIDPHTSEVSDQADDLAGSTFVELLQKMWQDLRTAEGFACFAAATATTVALMSFVFGDPVGRTTGAANVLGPLLALAGTFAGGKCLLTPGRLALSSYGIPAGVLFMLPFVVSSPQASAPSQPAPSPPPQTPAPPHPPAALPQPPRSPAHQRPPRRPRHGPRPMLFQHPGTMYHTILHP